MISIIIPVYNSKKHIEKNIYSILNQTYKDFELIIINDGSTDGSINIIKNIKDKRIKIYNKKHEGAGKARNFGIKKAKYPYLIFFDSDDYLEPNLLKKMINTATKKNPDIVICGFYSETLNGSKEEFNYKENYCKNKNKIGKEIINLYKNDLMYNVWNKLYKKEIIDKYNIEFPNILFGEDNLFNIEYLKHCNSLYNINNCLYHYVRELKNSITMNYISNFFDIRLNENKYFIDLFKSYNMSFDDYSNFISKRFIERTLGCLENLNRKNNLTLKEKLKETKKIITNEETKKYLKIYKSKNIAIKLFLISYKIKSAVLAYFVGYLSHKFKKIFPSFFNRIKNKR